MKILLSVLLTSSLLPGVTFFAQDATASPGLPKSTLCETGVFRKDKTTFVALTKTDKGFSYTFNDGIVGNMQDAGTILKCEKNAVLIEGKGHWPKVAIAEFNTRFVSNGVMLAGRLMVPPDATKNTPLVVYAHGSESTGWIDRARDPYQMVVRGVSVFIYDKRGTGLSSGEYTQNFPQLADDLVAASHEAKRLAEGQFGRFGLIGLSQGGWIVPLAAARAKAEFLGIGYGLVVDITEQDAAQVTKELRDRGYDDDVIAKASKVTNITAKIAKSRIKEGLEELAGVQNQFGKEAWFSGIKGGYSGVLVSMSVDDLRHHGVPQFDKLNIDWSINPMQVLSNVDAPQLWVFADEDRQAPGALTLERLTSLRKQGRDITIYRFPNTDHGMREYEEAKDGVRKHTRVTPGFYDLMADWAKGQRGEKYAKAYRE
ncbi:alpha/beta hydrolase family protein [Undibacterium sp. TJN19]|uniref:alpha/beta hydrolase family protein n=1 Tax=Undibacterium sp. TJN19 TaxID=3413055 RepID=UPI003BF365AD